MRRNKYGAVKTRIGDRVFASKAEALAFVALRQRQKNGEISLLKCQPRYPLTINGVCIGHYVADFSYLEGGDEVAHEVKGHETALWRWKKKHFLAEYRNVELRIVKA